MTTINWEDTEAYGEAISGLFVDDHKFVTVMPFSRLSKLVADPMMASNQRLRDLSAQLSEYYALHEEIQRAFDTGKKSNARNYSQYIVRIRAGDHGDTPTIDLFTPEVLALNESRTKILWPYDLVCVPYDGETQLAARFIAAGQDSETRKMPVIITITHGKPVAHARQCFHDRNAFQRRATVSVALAMDARDPMVGVIRSLEENVPAIKGQIIWRSRQMPAKGKDHIGAASFIRTAVVCFGHGISGVQTPSNVSLPEGMSQEDFTRRATIWFSRVVEKIGPYMRDRENYIASSPAIWAALGALGKPLTNSQLRDTALLESTADSLLATLNGVDWSKGPNWLGIAVKATSDGGFSFAGGAKDSGSIAFKALTESTDSNFRKIRNLEPTAVAA